MSQLSKPIPLCIKCATSRGILAGVSIYEWDKRLAGTEQPCHFCKALRVPFMSNNVGNAWVDVELIHFMLDDLGAVVEI